MDVSDSKKLKEWYEIVPNPLDQTDEQQAFKIKQGKKSVKSEQIYMRMCLHIE